MKSVTKTVCLNRCHLLLSVSVRILIISVLLFPAFSHAGRCATGDRKAGHFNLLPSESKLSRKALKTVPEPADATVNILVSRSNHFRIIWGNLYDKGDPDWADSGADGVPIWPEALADYLDSAYNRLTSLGFPAPYGSDKYYLDAYIDNTGVSVNRAPAVLASFEYAATKIDSDRQVAYFVFRRDYSLLTSENELGVLEATAAHELFHAIQRVYYPWDDPYLVPDRRWHDELWWFEATATWIEEICAPHSDDYIPYVQAFLSKPEKSLFASNGFREYGASVFSGFLWLRYSEEAVWKTVFSNAYDLGVEGAISLAVRKYAGQTLPDAVAEFWAIAAQPEVLWEDGARYYSSSSPKILQTVSRYPADISPSYPERPERYGANLYRIDAAAGSMKISMTETGMNSAWRIAASDAGADRAEIIGLKEYQGVLTKKTDAGTFLSVINVSDAKENLPYRIYIDPVAEVSDTEQHGNGGSGCFIDVLANDVLSYGRTRKASE